MRHDALADALATVTALETPDDRLRSILDFVNTDLGREHRDRRERQIIGFTLRLLQAPELAPRAFDAETPPSTTVLLDVQARLRTGLARLAAGTPWLLPAPASTVLLPDVSAGFPLSLTAPRAEPDRLVLSAALLVKTVGLPIRQCADRTCAKFFIPSKRQRYHAISCRWRVANRKRPTR